MCFGFSWVVFETSQNWEYLGDFGNIKTWCVLPNCPRVPCGEVNYIFTTKHSRAALSAICNKSQEATRPAHTPKQTPKAQGRSTHGARDPREEVHNAAPSRLFGLILVGQNASEARAEQGPHSVALAWPRCRQAGEQICGLYRRQLRLAVLFEKPP